MATDERWYFTKEQLANTPSRKCGIDADKELSCRQQAANLIQDMGQRLAVSQLCINTAIVYMHRFYVFHSLSHFYRNSMASAALFLAAKVEEQPRKLEHVIKVAHMCLHRETPNLDTKSEAYLDQAQDLVFNENVLLQTLGFDVAIDHPHTHVVRCCHLVKASKDLAQTSYFMASNSLHLTTMCLQYKPTVVACFCIHLACKWSNWEIPQSNEGKDWFWYVDKTVTSELLMQLTGEFLHIFDKCPSRLKRKILSISANQSPNLNHPSLASSPFDAEPRKVQSSGNNDGFMFPPSRPEKLDFDNSKKPSMSISGRTAVDYREYREKKERERLEREKVINSIAIGSESNKHHSHHHKQSSSSTSVSNKHTSSSGIKQTVHHNHHHHSSRPDVKSSTSQLMAQRHSTSSSSQARDRQRMSREYNSSSNTSGGTVYSSHSHSVDSNSLDSVMNSFSQEPSTVHPPEKLSNSHKSLPHNDPRHGKQPQQKDAKPYVKYPEQTSRTSRKPDILEQRSEEVRKLIEKPLPPPKPRAEVLKEEYAAMMLKQSHHPSKYGHQPDKPNMNSTSALPMSESKMLNVGQTAAFSIEKSPNAPVSASQIPHKSLPNVISKNELTPQPVKNGSSSLSLGLIDDVKPEKRPRSPVVQTPQVPPTKHRSLFSPEKTPTPMPSIPREPSLAAQRLKQKVKTSPAIPKSQELSTFSNSNPLQFTSDSSLNKQRLSNNMTAVSSMKHRSTGNVEIGVDQNEKQQQQQQQQQHQQQQQQLESHSRRFVPSFVPQETPGLSGNRMNELSQSVKENSVVHKNTLVDTKQLPDLTKSFDGIDSMSLSSSTNRHKQPQHHGMSNGLDTSLIKEEYSTVDPSIFLIKHEPPEDILSTDISTDLMFMKQDSKITDFLTFSESSIKSELSNETDLSSLKQESFSSLKTAQSISALLQEPLAPMPSLLQSVSNYDHLQQQRLIDESKSLLHSQQTQQHEHPLPSTVDMSDLVAPIQCSVEIPPPMAAAAVSVVVPTPLATMNSISVATSEEKKSEHRSKTEKKKKEKKHKHKDKDKSKEKHKHKHKDKDREKHHHREKSDREKDNKTEESGTNSGNGSAVGLGTTAAAPIKITIPKDKLNLGTDSIGTSSAASTPSSSSLKIKIPKDRLKNSAAEVSPQAAMPMPIMPQGPLKIKIRTDTLSRSSTGSDLQQDGGSRKRDRSEIFDGQPPAKKQQHHLQQQQLQQLQQLQQHQLQLQQQHQQHQQQRPNERQNGRHSGSYGTSSGSNNKPDRYYTAVEIAIRNKPTRDYRGNYL